MSYDSSKGKYYVDLPFGCLKKHAAIKFSKTEVVDDFIEFYSSLTSKNSNNRKLTATSFNGSNSNYFYNISSCTGRLTIADQGTIELTVAPKFDATSGTIKLGSAAQKTIDKQETLKFSHSDMINSSGTTYYMDIVCKDLILIKAKYYYRSDISFPYDMERTQILDWRNQSMSTDLVGPNIFLTGNYNNYNSADKYHRLNTSSCSPTVQNTAFSSDILALVGIRADTDDKTKIFLKWYMPEYEYVDNSTWFTGTVRLFSPFTRDSFRKYCQISPYSTTYNNMSNVIAHSFTTPYNSVLAFNGYQEANDTPTQAAEKVTEDVCSKLKAEHGNNLRIYLIEYRKQKKYKTFPAGEIKDYSYSTIENYADRKYEVNSKEELVSTLKTIADDIKKADFAGHTDAVEC